LLRSRKNRRRVDQAAVRSAARGLALRAGRLLLGVALFAGTTALAGLAAAKARTHLFTSPTFAIEKLELEGIRRANRAELVNLSGLSIGDNIFEADIASAEQSIARHPWVRRVSIERDYPRTLVARVVEHEPAALADIGGLYYVNEAGQAFKKLAPGDPADLPILRGVTRDEYTADEESAESLFREALQAIALYAKAGLDRTAPISEVKVDRLDGITFYCGKTATAVKVGTEGYEEKFARLEELLAELSRRGARAEIIRLDNRARPGWVAVQLAEGGVEHR
jgi:cell division protein FtsQ